MAYTLDQFCADHHALLTSGQPLAQTLPKIAEKLAVLLRNPQFVAETFNDATPVGRRDPASRQGHRRLCAGPRLRRPEERLAAQPRRVVGGVRHRAGGHQDDRMAAHQSRERGEAVLEPAAHYASAAPATRAPTGRA